MDDLQLLRVRVDARGHVVVSIPRATAEPVFGKDCHCAGERQVVIVGAGAAGVTAAQTLRQEGFQGRIIMVDKDPELPYDRTQLSKVLDATPLRRCVYRAFRFIHNQSIFSSAMPSTKPTILSFGAAAACLPST